MSDFSGSLIFHQHHFGSYSYRPTTSVTAMGAVSHPLLEEGESKESLDSNNNKNNNNNSVQVEIVGTFSSATPNPFEAGKTLGMSSRASPPPASSSWKGTTARSPSTPPKAMDMMAEHHNNTNDDSVSPLSSPLAQRSVMTAEDGSEPDSATSNNNKGGKSRRQKRLERNRESARLSRRRRKQYLEVLEERVSQLSHQVDEGRRHHVSVAVSTFAEKRRQHQHYQQQHQLFPSVLARASPELRVACTFRVQQLTSFCTPPAHKFILWLTLQGDDFYRGGRAASERLSAARIGERMLNNGNDKVTPCQTMWPLLCNEIGLSYDQEEKVRQYQRTLLSSQPESWLHRHAARASTHVLQTAHALHQAVASAVSHRERRRMTNDTTQQQPPQLSSLQQAKLSDYVASRRHELFQRLQQRTNGWATSIAVPDSVTSNSMDTTTTKQYHTDPSYHVAANLYILNHHLLQASRTIPPAAPLVVGPALKSLSRRPSFESLGARSGEKTNLCSKQDNESSIMRRESSAGSLKRSASEMSMEDSHDTQQQHQQHHRPSMDPMDAQSKAYALVQEHLEHVQPIIPKTRPPVLSMVSSSSSSLYTKPPSPPPPVVHTMPHLPVVPSSSSSYPQPPLFQQQPPVQHAQHTSSSSGFMDDDDLETLAAIGISLPDPVPVSVMSAAAPTYSMNTVEHHHHTATMDHHHHYTATMDHHHHHPAGSMYAFASVSESALPSLAATANNKQQHQPRRAHSSSFLPMVPEEMWSAEAAEDFLLTFVDDEDWAIGEGVETDLS